MTSEQQSRSVSWGRARRALSVVLAVVVALCVAGAPDAAAGPPVAVRVGSIPPVGPLFFHGLADPHNCTATVVSSPTQDLILTAAHCISGTAKGILFAPGYLDGATPYGMWTVAGAFVDPSWMASADPRYDYAFLRVAPQTRAGKVVRVQAVTGSDLLGLAPRTGTRMTVPAYPAGIKDAPINCTVQSYLQSGYTAFDCGGYVGGTSGSPMLVTGGSGVAVIAGVIGGLHQGGCFDYTSYSSSFRSNVIGLWLRAIWNRAPDVVRPAGTDGC